jgi:hypothetical protein
MGRDNIEQQTPDLFSNEDVGHRSTKPRSDATEVGRPHRLVLPKDLPNSIEYLDDLELDRLLAAAIDEAKRRGRPLASLEPDRTRTVVDSDETKSKRPRSTSRPTRRHKIGLASSPLTKGQVNAVRAAFKAGITPPRIARQFGLSHADVRKALSFDE